MSLLRRYREQKAAYEAIPAADRPSWLRPPLAPPSRRSHTLKRSWRIQCDNVVDARHLRQALDRLPHTMVAPGSAIRREDVVYATASRATIELAANALNVSVRIEHFV